MTLTPWTVVWNVWLHMQVDVMFIQAALERRSGHSYCKTFFTNEVSFKVCKTPDYLPQKLLYIDETVKQWIRFLRCRLMTNYIQLPSLKLFRILLNYPEMNQDAYSPLIINYDTSWCNENFLFLIPLLMALIALLMKLKCCINVQNQ